jgi:hypothetical protein
VPSRLPIAWSLGLGEQVSVQYGGGGQYLQPDDLAVLPVDADEAVSVVWQVADYVSTG